MTVHERRTFHQRLHRGLSLLLLALLVTSSVAGQPVAHAATLTNVAQGKPVVASDHTAAYVPANAVDGNLDTRWELQGTARVAQIEVDLQGTYDIATVQLHLGLGTNYAPTYVRVDYHDGFCWGQAQNARVTANPASGVTLQFAFAPSIVTRKVRVTVDGKSIQNNLIREIVANGQPTTAAPTRHPAGCGAGTHSAKQARQYNYAQWLPAEYDQSVARTWPLIISMHGIGGRVLVQTDHTQILASPEGLAKQIQNRYIPNLQAIVISPDCLPENRSMPSGGCWFTSAQIMTLLAQLRRELLVDADRIFVTGLSGGGLVSNELAINNPTTFAGLVPVAAAAPSTGHCTLNTLDVWAFGGDADSQHHPNTWETYKNTMVSTCGAGAGTTLAVTHYPTGHTTATWDAAYREPALQTFFSTVRRGPNTPLANVALLKPATASHTQLGHSPAFAVNGVVDKNRWISGVVNAERWLEVDLQGSYSLHKAAVYTGYINGTTDTLAIKNFDIRVWDGAAWVTIPGGSKRNGGDTETVVNLTFTAPVTASKVRLYCLDAYTDNCRLKELEIYGQ